jgi:transposase-like protein
MPTQRKIYSAELKARIALEAIKGQRTINEIAAHHGVHPNQVAQWKRQALAELPSIFSDRCARTERSAHQSSSSARSRQKLLGGCWGLLQPTTSRLFRTARSPSPPP